MGDWPLASGLRVETFGTSTGTTSHGGTTITSSATANTKGSWTQLAASTSFDAAAIMVNLDLGFTDTNYLVDIGIGASGSETVVIPNIVTAMQGGKVLAPIIPLAIPAGSRIAARCADNFGSSTVFMSISLFSANFVNAPPINNVTAYGVVTTGSKGTTVDAGATANTKGSWAQIVAATTQAHRGLMIGAVRPTMSTAEAAGYSQLTDIGIGASGSEQILVPDLRFNVQVDTGATSARGMMDPAFIVLPSVDIPGGSRLAIRQQSTTTNTTDRTTAYVLYGLG